MASSYSENLTIPDFLVQLMNLPNPPVAAPNGNGISFGHQQEKTHKMGKNEEEANDEEGEREEEEENRTGGKFQQRAICPYQFVLNHRPNRVPRTLVEVKCLSDRPSKRISFDQQIECRPMHWTLRVLYCKKGEKERNEDEEEDEEEEEEENGVVAEEEVNKNNKRRNNYQCRHAKERISLACLPMLAVAKRQKNAIENEDDDDGMVPVPAKPFDDPLEGT